MGARVVLSFENSIVTEVALTTPVTVVGRHPACDVVIDHPAISVRHMLFRIVDTTVYAEDLASTNGMSVNGISTSHQVVHHLDLIEVGLHKLHFFDDALLAGAVGDLESTVLTEFERTRMAVHVSESPAAPSAPRREDDLSRTMAIARDTLMPVTPGALPGARIALAVLAGERAGEVIALSQANTMLGPAGGDNALVVRRGSAFYLLRFSGNRPPRLNGKDLGPGTHPIAPQDVIDVGGSRFQVTRIE